MTNIERGEYHEPIEPRWVPASLPYDQCDLCGSADVAGYWLRLEPLTGRRLVASRCFDHADDA